MKPCGVRTASIDEEAAVFPARSLLLGFSVAALLTACACSGVAQTTPGNAPEALPGEIPTQDQRAIVTARKAAPTPIASDATVAVNENGRLRVVLKGSNGWTCLPSMATTAATGQTTAAPICVDGNGVVWIQAWLDHKPPPENRTSVAYMMQGEAGSASDPYAKTDTQSADWIQVGPHVMVMGARAMQEGLSASAPSKAGIDTTKPFLMWPGTPYEHLMIPLGSPQP